MKREAYFTSETLRERSQEMLSALETYCQRHGAQVLRPSCAALLVLDMQNYFLKSDSHAYIPSASAIVPVVRSLINAFREESRPVIFTRHVNTQQDADMMGKWWKDLISEDSPQSEVTRELNSTNGIVVNKTQYDAFWKTSLDETLRSMNVEQVVITGVMTHLCCETTARSAFVRGYEVFFTADGTATYTDAHHRAALLNLAHGFALPVLAEEVLDGFGKTN